MGSSLVFRPHAIIATDRSVPSPIFVAALIGVEKILRIDFDTSLPEATFVQQALAKIPEQTIAFGRPTGVTVALVQIAGAGKPPVLYCRDFKLGARHSTLQAQVDLGHPDVPVRIVPCGCDASIRYRRS